MADCIACGFPICQRCNERILRGEAHPIMVQQHIECAIRGVVGSLAHLQGTCSCIVPGSEEGDPPHLTKRQAAQELWAWLNAYPGGVQAALDVCYLRLQRHALGLPEPVVVCRCGKPFPFRKGVTCTEPAGHEQYDQMHRDAISGAIWVSDLSPVRN
jgi:hypothetical protein